MSFHSHLDSNTVIATKFCTWHDSCAVVACAKICCDLMASKGITARWGFHRIWIAGKKSLEKRAPGPWFEQHFENLEEHSRNLCISMNKGKNKSQIQYKSFIFFSTWCRVVVTAMIYREWWSTHSTFCIMMGPNQPVAYLWLGYYVTSRYLTWVQAKLESNSKIELFSISFFKSHGVYAR